MSESAGQRWTRERLPAAGVTLDCIIAGPTDGELVVMLHGFPDHALSWVPYVDAFATAGYRVIAPDQRGYGESDKPGSIADYGLDLLADDVCALIAGAGAAKAHVVGHDWGAVVVWWLAHARSQHVHTAAVLNVPHPDVMRKKVLFGSLKQMARSWYVFFFQLPWLPEFFLQRDDLAAMRGALQDHSIAGTFAESDLASVVQAWRQPGAIKAMVNWYRASLLAPPKRPDSDKIGVPFSIFWGDQDHVLGTEMIAPSMAMLDDGQLHRFADATHWINYEKSAELIPLLLSHFDRKTS